MVGAAVAPAGWAGAGLLGGASLGEAAAGAGAFLVSNPVGWAILATAAVGGVGYLGYKAYQNAHSQSQAKFQEKTISQACATCKDCNDLQKEIEKQQDEVDGRYDAMLKDKYDLYNAGPAGVAGKPYLGTWGGHQQQFQDQQSRLRKLLDAANAASCPSPNSDLWKSATKDPPTKPAGR